MIGRPGFLVVLALFGASPAWAGSRNIPPVNETEDQNKLKIGLRRLSENLLPSAGGDNLFFRDVQNNRIGIGTTTPSCALDISSGTIGVPPSAVLRGTRVPGRAGELAWDSVGLEMCVSTGTNSSTWVRVASTAAVCLH